ncbi:phage terminase large subunit family protein [Erythrobacter sp. F6033]|uniref:phage terminase large subunit family protein n=1 Tax=Erythrobacter sp. F6033 TaxID=2926401 RepID=UPI001FF57850|nr:phage terminase large subunit family protein [Erythrobacter sp. F6033]MCK0128051.1 phage terminase large subunit family protein [Erythrobacter sp. F6033]
MTDEISVPCPACGTAIPISPKALIMGEHFTCPNCKASIGLAEQGGGEVKGAMDKLGQLKDGAGV